MLRLLIPALCANLLTPALAEPKIGTWSVTCEPNAQNCRAGQYVASSRDPARWWVKLAIFSQPRGLLLVMITPPTVDRSVRMTFDQALATKFEAHVCDVTRCAFSGRLDPPAREMILKASTLTVKLNLERDLIVEIPIDIRRLAEALQTLPQPL